MFKRKRDEHSNTDNQSQENTQINEILLKLDYINNSLIKLNQTLVQIYSSQALQTSHVSTLTEASQSTQGLNQVLQLLLELRENQRSQIKVEPTEMESNSDKPPNYLSYII